MADLLTTLESGAVWPSVLEVVYRKEALPRQHQRTAVNNSYSGPC